VVVLVNRYLAARLMRSSIECATASAGSRRRARRTGRAFMTATLLACTALLWFGGRAL
jgi:hypothetical protein